jgi:hypothetical protein
MKFAPAEQLFGSHAGTLAFAILAAMGAYLAFDADQKAQLFTSQIADLQGEVRELREQIAALDIKRVAIDRAAAQADAVEAAPTAAATN